MSDNVPLKHSIVSVLGTDYTILFRNRAEDPLLKQADGYIDWTVRRIVIGTKDSDCELEDFYAYQAYCIRHEIVHAFFRESGMAANVENKNFGVPETYVDWFAVQAPKIFDAFRYVGVLPDDWSRSEPVPDAATVSSSAKCI